MRRLKQLIVATAWLAMAVVPALVAMPAQAAGPAPDSCVAIGLPVVPNAPGTCTAKDAQGNTLPGVSNDPKTGGAIVNYLRGWLILLNSAVALVILLMIIVSGVQYITAGSNPSMVKGAKDHLVNAVIALVLWLMMFAILQFLVPGGVL